MPGGYPTPRNIDTQPSNGLNDELSRGFLNFLDANESELVQNTRFQTKYILL